MKQICLSLSNVVASLRRALLVDALGENLLVRYAPSPRQGWFHRGGADGVPRVRPLVIFRGKGLRITGKEQEA